MTAWHSQSIEDSANVLAVDLKEGLTDEEAASRLIRYGQNKLREGKPISPLAIFIRQFKSVVIWVLIGAAIISIALSELTDGIAIIAIVVLNALIGFFQEYRAEKATAALKRLSAPRARVVRNGHATAVAATDVVPGDVLLLGSESSGVPPPVHERAQLRVRIPQATGTRSLNIAVAGGIALAEALRQTKGWP